MVVTDVPHLFPHKSDMKVKVTNMKGAEVTAEVNRDWEVEKLKQSLASLMSGSSYLSPAKKSIFHKIVVVRTGKSLVDSQSLGHQGVMDNDELLMLTRRTKPPDPWADRGTARSDRHAPSTSSIRSATADVKKKNWDLIGDQPDSSMDFQSELQRILISLIEASQRILCLNPEAAKIFKQAEDMLHESTTRKSELCEASVKQLTDMGFPEKSVRKALLINQQSINAAMEWLLSNGNMSDGDEPTAEEEVEEEQSETKGGGEADEGAVGGVEEGPKFKNILETIRAFQRKDFRPSPKALQNLLDMGFAEKEAITALRVARNGQDAACEWLLGERKAPIDSHEEGLDIEGPVYKALLAEPSIQLGLNSPRCLLAFLQMLENPLSASQWLNDPETGTLLMTISRIYHSEKLSPSFAFAPGPS